NKDPDSVWELLLAYVAALAGEREEAEGIFAQLDPAALPDGAYFAATIYGALGELDRGFAELERAQDVGFAVLATAAVDPALDPFRSDPRWKPFLRSLEELAQAIRELQGTESSRANAPAIPNGSSHPPTATRGSSREGRD